MKRSNPALMSTLCLALSAAACTDPSLSPLDEDFSDSEADDDSEEPPQDEPIAIDPAASEDLLGQLDPEQIIGGFIYDSDRDVIVLSDTPLGVGICTGTLVRNDVVLTAKHCVSSDGTIEGPELAANAIFVRQDGPGDSLGAQLSVTTIARMGSRDVAMLKLSGSFAIDGQTQGQSTQILASDQNELVGNNVLCQGFGRDTCDGGAGTLRGGLIHVTGNVGGMLTYAPIPGYDWAQWSGDSGSSCRHGAFESPRLRKALGVTSTAACGISATETGPELYRDWAVDQMNTWAGGDFLDPFAAPGGYDADVPAGMLQGPPNWQIAGGVLTESSNAHTNTTFHEGTRYINAAQVASDSIVRVTVSSNDDDAAGLVLRYRDDTHYYRLSFDEQRRTARIVRRRGNAWAVIAEDLDFDIDWSTSPEIAFYAWGTVLAGLVDGKLAIIGVDDDIDGYTAGQTGIYTWALSNATFDDLEIERF